VYALCDVGRKLTCLLIPEQRSDGLRVAEESFAICLGYLSLIEATHRSATPTVVSAILRLMWPAPPRHIKDEIQAHCLCLGNVETEHQTRLASRVKNFPEALDERAICERAEVSSPEPTIGQLDLRDTVNDDTASPVGHTLGVLLDVALLSVGIELEVALELKTLCLAAMFVTELSEVRLVPDTRILVVDGHAESLTLERALSLERAQLLD
jgi:hypothetical protein